MTHLKIVEGGWYQTRRGDVYGPMEWVGVVTHFEANGHAFDDLGYHFRDPCGRRDQAYNLIRRVNPPTDWVEPVTAAIPWDQPERLRVNGHKVTQIDPITIVGAPAFMVAWGDGSNQRAQWFRPDGKDEVYKITVDPVVAGSEIDQLRAQVAALREVLIHNSDFLSSRLNNPDGINLDYLNLVALIGIADRHIKDTTAAAQAHDNRVWNAAISEAKLVLERHILDIDDSRRKYGIHGCNDEPHLREASLELAELKRAIG